MKNLKTLFAGAAVITLIAALGCASKPTFTLPQVLGGEYKPTRSVKEVSLKNGMKIFFIQDKTLPITNFDLLIKAGAVSEPAEKMGINSITARLLEQGTQKQNFKQLSDKLTEIGASFTSVGSQDVTMISMEVVSMNQKQGLEMFKEVLLKPAFTEEEMKRAKSQIIAALTKKKDNPSAVIEDHLEEIIFQEHPYSRDSAGTPQTVANIARKDIIQHYYKYYRPQLASMAVSGYFDDAFEKEIVDSLEEWAPAGSPKEVIPKAAMVQPGKLNLFVKKDLEQTQIRVGRLGLARGSVNEYLQFKLINEILGGSFSSRLNNRIRVEKGLTYSIGSYAQFSKYPGAIVISTFTKNNTAALVVDEVKIVLKEFHDKGISEVELKAAKAQVKGQFPRAIETADQWANNYLMLDYFGMPKDYLYQHNSNVDKISLSEVNETIKKYYNPADYQVVVYGDSSIEKQFPGATAILEKK